MLSGKNKTDGDTGAENTQGVTCESSLWQRTWTIMLATMLLPTLLAFAYLLLLREPTVENAQLGQAAASYARQQAAVIEDVIGRYRLRLQAAASSPVAMTALESGGDSTLENAEKALLDFFPGLTSMRIISLGELGTAGLESDKVGLRNHIEVDMVRRAASDEPTLPESYQVDGRWLTSLVELVQHPEDSSKRAVILATMDNQVLTDVLARFNAELGTSALQQVFRQGTFTRADIIASAGSGSAARHSREVALNGDSWNLVFTPSAQMVAQYSTSNLPVLIVLAVTALAILIPMLLLLGMHKRHLSADVERILETSERRSALKIDQPELLPLAREIRHLAQRQVAGGGGAEKAVPRPADGGESMGVEELSEQAPEPSDEPAQVHIPDHIFRAYDIRGVVESELTEQVVAKIGGAIGTMAGKLEEQALIVGCDGRTSSPAIQKVLVKALLDTGRDVLDIGVVPTPLLYYATHTLSTRSGVMITASHNPADYNGFKITLAGKPVAGDELKALKAIADAGNFSQGAGRLAKQDVRSDYLDAIVSDVAITNPLKIVVDAGNGAAGELGPLVLESLNCEVERLYCEIDGTFPNHHPDPSVDANLEDLRTTVTQTGADFGVAFDGDGDRLTVVTGDGDIVRNDKLLMLFAQDIVSRNPGADVVFDIKCTRHLTQLVSGLGGRPILWKTGHAFMRQKVAETGALLGGEFSGHMYFGERWYGFDDAVYAVARLAEIISGTGIDLPGLLQEFPVTVNTPEIHIPVAEDRKFALMERIAAEADFSPGKVTDLDGIRVDYNDCWGLVRASNTTPALIARFEGENEEALQRIQQQFRDQIAALEPGLDLGF